MRVSLSVVNRLSLLGLLENKGDLTTLKVIRELREELSFTEAEHKVLHFQPLPGERVTFDETVVPDKEFEFEGIRKIIIEKVKTQLKELEEKQDLTLDLLPLYEVLIEK